MNGLLDLYKWFAILLLPSAALGLLLSLNGMRRDIPGESRDYMDPLPSSLRTIWPLVNLLGYYVGERLPVEWLEFYAAQLRKAGLNYLMTPAQCVGLQLAGGLVAAVAALSCSAMLSMYSLEYPLFGFFAGACLPLLSIVDAKKKREGAIVRGLPVYLDFLTMATQAGLSVTAAIHQAVDKGPDSPLKIEFRKFIRDLRAGIAKEDALRLFAERLDLAEISAFITAVIQAERTGAAIGETLRIQADQRRVERFQRAEKLAMQAPVKMIFPLVAFIFPTTFIVIFYPIAVKLMASF